MDKKIPKYKIISELKKLGHTEIELTYDKSEGWWLLSNSYDDWVGINSTQVMANIKLGILNSYKQNIICTN